MPCTPQLQLYTPPDEATYVSLRDMSPEASPTWERATRWELTPDGYEDEDDESPIYELLSDSAMARCGVNPTNPSPSSVLPASPFTPIDSFGYREKHSTTANFYFNSTCTADTARGSFRLMKHSDGPSVPTLWSVPWPRPCRLSRYVSDCFFHGENTSRCSHC